MRASKSHPAFIPGTLLVAAVAVVCIASPRLIAGLWLGTGTLAARLLAAAADLLSGGFILAFAVNAAPFVAVALYSHWLQRSSERGPGKAGAAFFGLWGALAALSMGVFTIHLLVWIDALSGGPGSSTSVVALFLAPIYGVALLAMGYLLGLLVGLMLSRR